jgi:hypothetical protein
MSTPYNKHGKSTKLYKGMTASIFKERYRKQQAWKQHMAGGVARIFGQGGVSKNPGEAKEKIFRTTTF